jgi:hypothetical protein
MVGKVLGRAELRSAIGGDRGVTAHAGASELGPSMQVVTKRGRGCTGALR